MDIFTKRIRIVIAAALLVAAVYFSYVVIIESKDPLLDVPKRDIININTATEEELMKFDGIGEKTAKKIIKYREENDGFKRAEEIMEIDGIGEVFFENNKKSIIV